MGDDKVTITFGSGKQPGAAGVPIASRAEGRVCCERVVSGNGGFQVNQWRLAEIIISGMPGEVLFIRYNCNKSAINRVN